MAKEKTIKKVRKKAAKQIDENDPAQLELLFINRMEEMASLKGQHEYLSSLYAAVQRFHKEVANLNKLYNQTVKDIVYFDLE